MSAAISPTRGAGLRVGATLLLALCALGATASCGQEAWQPPEPVEHAPRSIIVSTRVGRLKNHPCDQCHNPTMARTGKLPANHREIQIDHFEGAQTCGTCHDVEDMNSLHLVSGKPVALDAAHDLCGQCHAEKVADWKIGAHGKHVGRWSGPTNRYTCPDCHNPHSPGLGTLTARPAPPFPRLGIPKGEH